MAIRHKGRHHSRDNRPPPPAGGVGRRNAPTNTSGSGLQARPAQARPAHAQSAEPRSAQLPLPQEQPAAAQRPLDPKPARNTLPPRARAAAPPREGRLWLYGRHAVAAALANPARRIRRFLAVAEMATDAKTLVVAPGARLPAGPQPEILPRAAFEALVPAGAVHQGIALSAEPLPELAIDDVIDRIAPPPAAGAVTQIVVLLDQLSDPHIIAAVLPSPATFAPLPPILPSHVAPPPTTTP